MLTSRFKGLSPRTIDSFSRRESHTLVSLDGRFDRATAAPEIAATCSDGPVYRSLFARQLHGGDRVLDQQRAQRGDDERGDRALGHRPRGGTMKREAIANEKEEGPEWK